MGLFRKKNRVNLHRTAEVSLDGKTVIVTGCDRGIGRATVHRFVELGARVIMACVEIENAEKTAAEIRTAVTTNANAGEIRVLKLDLASLASVRECAQEITDSEPQIHLLVNNAGICLTPYKKTEDQFEQQFQINYLGHFLFTCLLLPRMMTSAPSRIVNVASMGHKFVRLKLDDLQSERSYSPAKAYLRSKLALMLFNRELGKRLQGSGVTTYAVHPGLVRETTILDSYLKVTRFTVLPTLLLLIFRPWTLNPEQGAQTTIYCATNETAGTQSGLYYSYCQVKEPSRHAEDDETAKKLWEESVRLVKLDFDPFESLKPESTHTPEKNH